MKSYAAPDWLERARVAHEKRMEAASTAPPVEPVIEGRVDIRPRKCIGPSNLSSVLGLNPYKSEANLRAYLRGESSYSGSPTACQYGIAMEETAIRQYEIMRDTLVRQPESVRAFDGRLFGKADGLVGEDGLVEIKCLYGSPGHPPDIHLEVPDHYLPQIVAYMWLYRKKWCDYMSIIFDEDHIPLRAEIIRVHWSSYEDTWNDDWLPKIRGFIKSVWIL